MEGKARCLLAAVLGIEEALNKLINAHSRLELAKHDKRFDLGRTIIDLEQIHDILTDPECTPEIKVGGSS